MKWVGANLKENVSRWIFLDRQGSSSNEIAVSKVGGLGVAIFVKEPMIPAARFSRIPIRVIVELEPENFIRTYRV